ncbi:MAG: serine hydrolase domain-containing protein, partial [Candidatus Aminicenantales bacterium]
KHIPEFPDYGAPITLRHLIHHTSGIRDYLTLMDLAGAREDDYYVDGEVVELLARQKELNFQPGADHLYSNSGYFLLSEIVRRVTGKPMSAYAREKIFQPLGMKNTHFHDDHTMVVRNRAVGYSPKKGGGFRIHTTPLDMIGDGGVFTCVDDLLLWERNFAKNRLGRRDPELIEKMHTRGKLNSGEELDYAFGLVVSEHKGLKMVHHGGAFAGYRAEMIRFPEEAFSVIVLANLSSINPSRLAQQVADIYLEDRIIEEKEEPVEEPHFVELPEAELRKKTGAYHNKKTDALLEVVFEEGKLWVDTFSFRFEVAPLSPERFLSVDRSLGVEVVFEPRRGGKPPRLHLKRGEEKKADTYDAVAWEVISPDQLSDYVGEYFSEELQVTCRILVEKERLFIRHENPYKNYPRDPLKPTLKDRFVVEGIHLKFFRDRTGRIISFTANAGRVKNIRFDKRRSRP